MLGRAFDVHVFTVGVLAQVVHTTRDSDFVDWHLHEVLTDARHSVMQLSLITGQRNLVALLEEVARPFRVRPCLHCFETHNLELRRSEANAFTVDHVHGVAFLTNEYSDRCNDLTLPHHLVLHAVHVIA
ncbi:hypothetical protein D3C80_1265360 [compost metagenome]